jgi:glutamine synthetase adenylyltransferase
VSALGEAYAFLRKLEHRCSTYDDQQTQALPRDESIARSSPRRWAARLGALHAALRRIGAACRSRSTRSSRAQAPEARAARASSRG